MKDLNVLGCAKMKSILFVVIKSPFISNAAEGCKLLSLNGENAVLLTEDGVYNAVHDEKRKELLECGFKLYAIEDNLAARGFVDFKAEGVEVIDCSRAIDLIMEEFDTSITV